MSEIDRLIKSGVLLAKKDGRRTVIERGELDRYADRLPSIEPERRMFSRKAAGAYLDKSVRAIDYLISSGELVAKKDGRRTVIDRAELDRYVDRLPCVEPRR